MSTNKHFDIEIPSFEMEHTIRVCQKELSMVRERKQTSMIERLLQFMRMELSLYVKLALVGMVLTLFIISFYPDSSQTIIMIYFMGLGSFAIYEHYKASFFQIYEILCPVYINHGRAFLYKSACFSVVQFVILVIICLIISCYVNIDIVHIILTSLIPIYIVQIVSLYLIDYIKGMIPALSLYLLLYGVLVVISEQFKLHTKLSLGQTCILLATMMGMFILAMLYIYHRKQQSTDFDFGSYEH